MKRIPMYYGVLIIIIGMIGISGCKKKSDPIPVEQAMLNNLAKTWTLTSAELDNVDYTDYYGDFSLLISGVSTSAISYNVSNRPHYSSWPSNGTLKFGQNATSTLIRDVGTADEVTLTYTVTTSTLEIRFNFSGDPYNARTSTVTGEWVFVFGL